MFRGLRAPRWFVQRDIHALVRSFPSERLTIVRPTTVVSGMETTTVDTVVFVGEALFIPQGGEVKRFGLGQVEEDRPYILVPGNHDIRQGDMVTRSQMLPGGVGWEPPRRYQILYPPNHWQAFTVCTLNNFEQGQL